jgi:hypothetical protein
LKNFISITGIGKPIAVVCNIYLNCVIHLSLLTCSSCEANDEEDEIRSLESLQFDFGTIRVATDNFSEENKLGHGGFGDVYKVINIIDLMETGTIYQ